MMRKLMLHLGPRFEGALYTILLSRVIGLEAASALVLIGIPILIVRVLRYHAS